MEVNQALFEACLLECSARKLGNVSPVADFPDMTFLHLVRSAQALSQSFNPAASVGENILAAVTSTRNLVHVNTNLGIALLLMPLAAVQNHITLEQGVPQVLRNLTQRDAAHAYEAIRRAAPAGLGTAKEQDVSATPSVTLLQAMQLAEERDRIAWQYSHDFVDLFSTAVPLLLDGFQEYSTLEAAILSCQLGLLCEFPDSHLVRKHGPVVAEQVQFQARSIQQLGGYRTKPGRTAAQTLDRWLRQHQLNPGTTADLVAAALFMVLREDKLSPLAPFADQGPPAETT